MLIAALGQYFFGITIFITSMFLIMLVLVQRGRGGGLAGALGGPGGQSAFGTKAGDLFTRITIGVAAVWIFLCAAAVVSLKAKKFTTNVTRSDSSSGSMSGAGSMTGTNGADSNGLESSLPNAATPGLDIAPSSTGDSAPPPATGADATTPPATTPPATTAPATTAPATGTAEVSELPTTETPAAETPATGDAPTAEDTGDISLDDPAAPASGEQP